MLFFLSTFFVRHQVTWVFIKNKKSRDIKKFPVSADFFARQLHLNFQYGGEQCNFKFSFY